MSLPAKNPPISTPDEKRSVGKGVFHKCASCGAVHTAEVMAEAFQVCPSCGHHHRLDGASWQRLLLDGPLEAWEEHLQPADPLHFDDGRAYTERISSATKKTNLSEAVQVGKATIEGVPLAFGAFQFDFMGGSMGSVVGERITRMFERAGDLKLPAVLMHASGGARMQEGILSLMQMAKTVSAMSRFRRAGRPFISVCIHPTTGGVAASTALLGDVNLVEPNALIGFAGPRVIETTLRTKLPEGFQRSEFLLDHGMIDTIVPRTKMRETIGRVLRILAPDLAESHDDAPGAGESAHPAPSDAAGAPS